MPPIISGTGKATNFNFCTLFHAIDYNKSPLIISGEVAVGVARDSRKFSWHPYMAHRAVIFAIARLSCSDTAGYDWTYALSLPVELIARDHLSPSSSVFVLSPPSSSICTFRPLCCPHFFLQISFSCILGRPLPLWPCGVHCSTCLVMCHRFFLTCIQAT